MVTQNITNFNKTAHTILESEDLENEESYLDETPSYTQEEISYLKFIKSKIKAKRKWSNK